MAIGDYAERTSKPDRALLYLTDYNRVVLIPTTDEYLLLLLLLLNVQQPEQLFASVIQGMN